MLPPPLPPTAPPPRPPDETIITTERVVNSVVAASVAASVVTSIATSVAASVSASVGASVTTSVGASVGATAAASVTTAAVTTLGTAVATSTAGATTSAGVVSAGASAAGTGASAVGAGAGVGSSVSLAVPLIFGAQRFSASGLVSTNASNIGAAVSGSLKWSMGQFGIYSGATGSSGRRLEEEASPLASLYDQMIFSGIVLGVVLTLQLSSLAWWRYVVNRKYYAQRAAAEVWERRLVRASRRRSGPPRSTSSTTVSLRTGSHALSCDNINAVSAHTTLPFELELELPSDDGLPTGAVPPQAELSALEPAAAGASPGVTPPSEARVDRIVGAVVDGVAPSTGKEAVTTPAARWDLAARASVGERDVKAIQATVVEVIDADEDASSRARQRLQGAASEVIGGFGAREHRRCQPAFVIAASAFAERSSTLSMAAPDETILSPDDAKSEGGLVGSLKLDMPADEEVTEEEEADEEVTEEAAAEEAGDVDRDGEDVDDDDDEEEADDAQLQEFEAPPPARVFTPIPGLLTFPNLLTFGMAMLVTGLVETSTQVLATDDALLGCGLECKWPALVVLVLVGIFLLLLLAMLTHLYVQHRHKLYKKGGYFESPAEVDDPVLKAVGVVSLKLEAIPAFVTRHFRKSEAEAPGPADEEAQEERRASTSSRRVKGRTRGEFVPPQDEMVEPARTERLLTRPCSLFSDVAADAYKRLGIFLSRSKGDTFSGISYDWLALAVQVAVTGLYAAAADPLEPPSDSLEPRAQGLLIVIVSLQFSFAAWLLLLGPGIDRFECVVTATQFALEGCSCCLLLSEQFTLGFVVALVSVFLPVALQLYDFFLVALLAACRKGERPSIADVINFATAVGIVVYDGVLAILGNPPTAQSTANREAMASVIDMSSASFVSSDGSAPTEPEVSMFPAEASSAPLYPQRRC